MSLFPCAACIAKDLEIARLWGQNRELLDRFSALTSTLAQIQDGRIEDEPEATEPDTGNPEPPMTDREWEASELERAALEVKRKGGRVTPDFPGTA